MNTPKLETNPGTLLTPRQAEALLWTALGKTTEEVGTILGIAASTAKTHIDMTMAKLHANSKPQLVTNAFVGGYLRKASTCLLLAFAAVLPAPNSNGVLTDDDQRAFRQVRTRRREDDPLNPNNWEIDCA